MKKLAITLVCALCAARSAGAFTLEECQNLAAENYPAIKDYNLIAASRDFDLSNAAKGWLPKISVQAGGYGFTDILNSESQLNRMGVEMKNYVVSGNVTVRQAVYDGGQIAAGKRMTAAKAETELRNNDVTMYNIKVRARELYFGVLLLDEKLRQNELLQEDIKTCLRRVENLLAGGMAKESDLDVLRVELLNAEQGRTALEASRMAYVRMLAVFTGKELGAETAFERPAMIAETDCGEGEVRPEMSLFNAKDDLLTAQRKQINSGLLPTVGFMGTGMYHTRVSDLVNNGLLLGGLSVSWNVGALYTRKNDLRRIETERSRNEVQRQSFLFNNRLQREEISSGIAAMRKQLESDEEIVRLRESIRKRCESGVASGTESVEELARSLNAVSLARGLKAQHEAELLKAMYALQSAGGGK